ncbi:hypothetical protein SMNI109538_25455 [Smaragdicoccus niigatensis]
MGNPPIPIADTFPAVTAMIAGDGWYAQISKITRTRPFDADPGEPDLVTEWPPVMVRVAFWDVATWPPVPQYMLAGQPIGPLPVDDYKFLSFHHAANTATAGWKWVDSLP